MIGRFLKRAAKLLGVSLLALLALALVLRLAFPLPDISERPEDLALTGATETTLEREFGAQAQDAGAGMTGVSPLSAGRLALTARIALADKAERSLDLQYYIWHDDTSGILLLDALKRAADRGVQVRLLLDDNGIPGLDAHLAALDSHESVQVRLFNPSPIRSPKMLGYVADFFRMNRRMHNKSFIADNTVAVIGGRNIGDEYFSLLDESYVDMDVLAAGAVVPETVAAFDSYWNSRSVYEAASIFSQTGDAEALEERIAEVRSSGAAQDYFAVYDESLKAMGEGGGALEWTQVQLVVDDPVKGLGQARRDQLMITRLGEILGQVEERVDLVSAYFIPGKVGTKWFSDRANAGVTVSILTNAMNTTDVFLVHAGYTKYRRELLEAGVQLYELKLRGVKADPTLPFGLSGAALHAKTFAIDGERVFIGSFNFDPRSAMLNCEMGFLIDSETIARRVSNAFDSRIATVSYRPALTPEGNMVWRDQAADGEDVIYQQEPGANWVTQVALVVVGLLPVEWLL